MVNGGVGASIERQAERVRVASYLRILAGVGVEAPAVQEEGMKHGGEVGRRAGGALERARDEHCVQTTGQRFLLRVVQIGAAHRLVPSLQAHVSGVVVRGGCCCLRGRGQVCLGEQLSRVRAVRPRLHVAQGKSDEKRLLFGNVACGRGHTVLVVLVHGLDDEPHAQAGVDGEQQRPEHGVERMTRARNIRQAVNSQRLDMLFHARLFFFHLSEFLFLFSVFILIENYIFVP